MAMTSEERKAARREASKRWYAAHKAKGAANANQGKAGRSRPAAKKAICSGADENALIMKQVDRLVKKNAKVVSQVKSLVKDAAGVLACAYKTGDEKLIASVQKALCKNLCVQVGENTYNPDGKARKCASFEVGTRLFRVPKRSAPDVADAEPSGETSKPAQEAGETAEQPAACSKEVPVDPSKLECVESGDLTEEDITTSSVDEDDDEDEEDEEDEEDDDVDEDELSDEEREERQARRAEKDAEDYEEDYLSGRADMLRELGAQGFGEED